MNVNTGASGITPLNDLTEYHQPSLSKTVISGPGTVIASMWGIIDYPFAHCVMTPTVGLFVVPDKPVGVPAAPPPPTPGLITPGRNGTEVGPALAPEAAPSVPAGAEAQAEPAR